MRALQLSETMTYLEKRYVLIVKMANLSSYNSAEKIEAFSGRVAQHVVAPHTEATPITAPVFEPSAYILYGGNLDFVTRVVSKIGGTYGVE